MKRLVVATLAALTWVLTSGWADDVAAAEVWRCGPDGRQYRATPCDQGQRLSVSDAVDHERRREAQDVAAREASALRRLAAERRQREAGWAQAAPAGIKPRVVDEKRVANRPAKRRRPGR